MSQLETFAEFGFKKDPFSGCFLETADVMRIGRLVDLAISGRRMIAIVAERGTGKTEAINYVLPKLDVRVVRAEVSNKERMTIDNIEHDLISGLSDEPARRSANTRKRQLRRILGEAARKKPVVLVIEEAHRIHAQTLRSLKTLMEMEWVGIRPLFVPILVGQYDPMSKKGVDEVRLRSDSVLMKGLAASEVVDYVKGTVGDHFDADAIDALSRVGTSRNFLELQEACVTLMERALAMGETRVTVMEVFELYGGGLKELLKSAGISETELSTETGIAKATVSGILNDKQRTSSDDTFRRNRSAIGEVLRRRMEEETGKTDASKSITSIGSRSAS
jgi:type II secretory pathway predicted ATPase ExeA